MKRAIVAIVGRDRPGIVHKVSRVLANKGCHILSVSQTTLLGQFAGLFATNTPENVSPEDLSGALSEELSDESLSHWVTAHDDASESSQPPSEPYVLTIFGPDHPEIIPEVTKTVASFEANIENLRAVPIDDGDPFVDGLGSGGPDGSAAVPDGSPVGPQPIALVLEISVPVTVRQGVFRQALSLAAEERGVEISLQHRNIFEAIHRV
ncbi:MAG: hypothetical protein LBJ61_12165 [Deltaproteobacteria bacterium]|jgi:glycine cleavage system transcriptional repressor|nr:hypothetical protein [Deltaproteobacteria bacterium]